MLQREKDLKAKVESLTQEKQERLKTLKRLKDQDQQLCDTMCLTPYYIPTGATPTTEQLKALEQHVSSLKIEKVG
jgi:protein regulator of cytokinesis 1